jgi:hypothetical protein
VIMVNMIQRPESWRFFRLESMIFMIIFSTSYTNESYSYFIYVPKIIASYE